MTHKPLLDRPALTAIAAALALASTPAFAQEIAPADAAPAPVTALEPAPASPVTPQAAAPALPPIVATSPQTSMAPVAVATPTLPEIATQSTPAEPVRRVATRTAPVERAAAPARPVPVTPQVAVTTPPTAQPAQSAVLQSPMLTPSDLRAMEQRQAEAQVAPAPETAAATQPDNTAYWVIGSGSAALILGFGAFAFLRRRDRTVDAREEVLLTRNRRTAGDEPLAPAIAATPAASEWTEPVIVARKQPQTGDARFAELEAMIAKRPTIANPFLTRAKRLRRANFILTHDGKTPASFVTEPARVAAPVEERKAAVATAPASREPAKAPAKKHQKEPVFSFTKKPASRRSTGLKPATT